MHVLQGLPGSKGCKMPIEKKRTRRNRTRFFHDFRSFAPDPEKKKSVPEEPKEGCDEGQTGGNLGAEKGGMGVSPQFSSGRDGNVDGIHGGLLSRP